MLVCFRVNWCAVNDIKTNQKNKRTLHSIDLTER